MTFKKIIKKLRTEKGLTQIELAEILKYGRTAISNYESGRSHPSFQDLERIANYFNVSTDYLLGRTNDPTTRIMEKEELPKELKDIGIEYLEVFKEAKSSDITPEDISEIINIIKKGRNKR